MDATNAARLIMNERETLCYILGIISPKEKEDTGFLSAQDQVFNEIRQVIKSVLYPYPNTTWFRAPKDWQKITLKETAND